MLYDGIYNGPVNRDARFEHESTHFSPAGVNRLLTSKPLHDLFRRMRDKPEPDRLIIHTPVLAEMKRIDKMQGKAKNRRAALLVAMRVGMDMGELTSNVVTESEHETFVPVLSDDFENAEAVVRLGLAKEGDCVQFSFFPHMEVGKLACMISINDVRACASGIVTRRGLGASYKQWCCAGCNIVTDGRLKCSVCRSAIYCSKACQKSCWGEHRLFCGSPFSLNVD